MIHVGVFIERPLDNLLCLTVRLKSIQAIYNQRAQRVRFYTGAYTTGHESATNPTSLARLPRPPAGQLRYFEMTGFE